MHMRIALRMDITQAAIQHFRLFQDGHNIGGRQVASGSGLDISRRLSHQERQPTLFQSRAGAQDQIGTPYFGNQAGTSPYVVRVLPGVSGGEGLHLLTAYFFSQGGPFGFTGEDIHLRLDCGGGRAKKRDHQYAMVSLHDTLNTYERRERQDS